MTRRRRMSPEVRHRVMASIRKRDTAPELALRSALWASGVRGWRCHTNMPGTPDLSFYRWRVAVFVDGVWWHGHPDYLPRGRRGSYWDKKIGGNRTRDRLVSRLLRGLGWRVVRIWDLEVLSNPHAACEKVTRELYAAGWRPAIPQLPPRPMVSKNSWVEPVALRKLVAEPAAPAWPLTKHVHKHRRSDSRGQ